VPHLVLVRHARPEVVRGAPSILWRLSEDGRKSCEALADKLRAYGLRHVVTSTEPKAFETGRLLSTALGIPVSKLDGLEEHHRDAEQFVDNATFEARIGDLFRTPDRIVFGSETASAAASRFTAAVEQSVASYPGESLAVVAHGTVISLVVAARTGMDGFDLWRRLGMPSLLSFVCQIMNWWRLCPRSRPRPITKRLAHAKAAASGFPRNATYRMV
jgi:broad specificity phosphatase PhoE